MCVIIYKPAGVQLETITDLQDAFLYNDDGAGFAYNRNGVIHVHKGFTTYADFTKALEACGNLDAYDLTIHFRISTGGNGASNTHPFSFNDKLNNGTNYKTTEPVLFHNGVIHWIKPTDNESDTRIFTREYVSAVNMKKPKAGALIEELAGGYNKFIIMTASSVHIIGEFTIINGVYYSNRNHATTLYDRYYSDRDRFDDLDAWSHKKKTGGRNWWDAYKWNDREDEPASVNQPRDVYNVTDEELEDINNDEELARVIATNDYGAVECCGTCSLCKYSACPYYLMDGTGTKKGGGAY